MTVVIVLGLQFGDEGKGKVVDVYAQEADMIVRFQGGANAGHTVVVGEETYKFHLMPSGVLQHKQVVIGNGVVIDPAILLQEINYLEERGISINLRISDRAHIVLPIHVEIDQIEEQIKGNWSAGTTKRGIGPTYTDKVARFGIRVHDLINRETLTQRLETLQLVRNPLMKEHRTEKGKTTQNIVDTYLEYGSQLQKFITDTSIEVNEAINQRKNVLFEGAQGTMLDIDFGIYPFGTSSNTIAGGACTGVGVAPTKIDSIIGVVKAYTSRVGTGYFPTELKDAMGDRIQEKGKEFGTTTGRPRRCGWLDLFAVQYAVNLNAPDGLVITKLDVLGGIDPIKMCTGYYHKEIQIQKLPANSLLLKECHPCYEEVEGWSDLTPIEWRKIARDGYNALPLQAKNYLNKISDFLKVPIHMVSVGAEREATVIVKNVFDKAK